LPQDFGEIEMTGPRYRSFAEFEREYIKPNNRVGQSFEDMIMDQSFEADFRFERDEEEEDEDDY